MQQTETRNEKLNNIVPFIPEGDFYFAKGVEAFQKHKFDIAIKWMQKAIEAVPKEPLYQCQMSIIYTEIGLFHKANQLLTNVLQINGDNYMDCYYLLANNYAHLGLLNDAKKYAFYYLDNDPEGDFCNEAKMLLDLIDIDEVEDEWELDDEDELLLYQETAFHHLENMEWKSALEILEEMVTLFPEHRTCKHEYAVALFYSNYKDDAIQLEMEILEDNPNSLYSHANLALFFYELGNEDYEDHIRALLNVYPLHEQQKLKIAVTLAKTGYIYEACSRFASLNKGEVSSHLSYFRWYSYALYQLGKLEKAAILWQEGCKRHTALSHEVQPWKN